MTDKLRVFRPIQCRRCRRGRKCRDSRKPICDSLTKQRGRKRPNRLRRVSAKQLYLMCIFGKCVALVRSQSTSARPTLSSRLRSGTQRSGQRKFGATLRHPDLTDVFPESIEGGRSTAAISASRFGNVLKISEDGLISFFQNGRCAWDI